MAAMLVADDDENITDLDRVLALADHQSDVVERARPIHPLARESTIPRGSPGPYDLLITRATAARAMAVTHAFQRRMEAARHPVIPREASRVSGEHRGVEPVAPEPFLPDKQTRAVRLQDFCRDCFELGVFEASYHLLMAAVFSAEAGGLVADLESVTTLATQQSAAIDSITPSHRLSRSAATGRTSPALYELLISRSEAATARLTTLKFRPSSATDLPAEGAESA